MRAHSIPVIISVGYHPGFLSLYRGGMFSILNELRADGIHNPDEKGSCQK